MLDAWGANKRTFIFESDVCTVGLVFLSLLMSSCSDSSSPRAPDASAAILDSGTPAVDAAMTDASLGDAPVLDAAPLDGQGAAPDIGVPLDLNGQAFSLPVWSLSIGENFVIAGVHATPGHPAVSIFERACGGWMEVTRLYPDDPAHGGGYGHSVAASGTTGAIGSFLEADGDRRLAGAVHIYDRSAVGGWERTQTLWAPATRGLTKFGMSVALQGDTMVVGAPGAGIDSSGAAYVFERHGGAWELTARLAASTPVPQSSFGIAVAISEDTIIIGADHHDGAGYLAGAAYAFVREDGRWSQQAFLAPDNAVPIAHCGASVDVWRDTAVIGCPAEDGTKGGVHLFTRDSGRWRETQVLSPLDQDIGDWFGIAVGVHESRLVAGSYGDKSHGLYSGAAHVFAWNGASWLEEQKIAGTEEGTQLGVAVDIVSPDTVAVGSLAQDVVTPSTSLWVSPESPRPACAPAALREPPQRR